MASTRGRSMVNERKAATFVFGSSTPRDLSYMSKVPQQFRTYDSKPQKVPPPNKDETLQHYMRQARSLTPHLSGSREGSCDRMRSSFAFGSSTPRQFSHLSTIQSELRIYDAKITPKVDKRSYTTSMITSLRSRTVPATARIASQQLPPKPQKNKRKRSEEYGRNQHNHDAVGDETASKPDFVQDRTTQNQQKNQESLKSIKNQLQSDPKFKKKQKEQKKETIVSKEVKDPSPKKVTKKIEKHHHIIRTTTNGDGEKMAATVEEVIESVKKTGKEASIIASEQIADLSVDTAPSCMVPQTISTETSQLIAKNAPIIRPLNDSSEVTVINDVKTTPEEQRLNGFLGELKSEGIDLNLTDESSSVQKLDSMNTIDTRDHHTDKIDSTETKPGTDSSFDTTFSDRKHTSQILESEEEGSSLESQLLDTTGKYAPASSNEGTAERKMELHLSASAAYETKSDTKSNVRFVETNEKHLPDVARSPQPRGTQNAPHTDPIKKSPEGGDQSFSSPSDAIEPSRAEPTEAPILGSLKHLNESEYERSPEDMTRSIHEDISGSNMAESMHESANSSEGIRSIHDADENSVNLSSTDINKVLSPSTATSTTTTDIRSFHESAHSPQHSAAAISIFDATKQQTTNRFLSQSSSQSPMDDASSAHDRTSPNQSISSLKDQSIDQLLHHSSYQDHGISQAHQQSFSTTTHMPTQQRPDQPMISDEKNVLSSDNKTIMSSSEYAIQEQHSPEQGTYYIHQQHHKQTIPSPYKQGINEPQSVIDSEGNRIGVNDNKAEQYNIITSHDDSLGGERRIEQRGNVTITDN